MASNKKIVQVFEDYQKARLAFVQEISDLALRQQNVDVLVSGEILELLKPLLSDPCIQIQQCATAGLGRILHQREDAALRALELNVLPILITNIEKRNKYQKKSILFCLRSICRHGVNLSRTVAHNGGVHAALLCLEDFESMVKEAAAWVMGYIARCSEKLSDMCIQAGAVPLLVACLEEPDVNLKLVSTSALADIAKHNLYMAQIVEDAGAFPHWARILASKDLRLKRQVLTALSCCAKHSAEIAGSVVEAEVFPSVIVHLSHTCEMIAHNATVLVKDVVKHSSELCHLMANIGAIDALLQAIRNIEVCKTPGITALGYMAAYSDTLAMSILTHSAYIELPRTLKESTDDERLSVTAWALGHLGKHSPDHSELVATTGDTLVHLLELFKSETLVEETRYKARYALKMIIRKCVLLTALEPLLEETNQDILKHVLRQYSIVLPHDAGARRHFVTIGALKKIQEIEVSPGSSISEYIAIINAAFPEELLRYYTPGYPETLLEAAEQYAQDANELTWQQRINVDKASIQSDYYKFLPSVSESVSSASDDDGAAIET